MVVRDPIRVVQAWAVTLGVHISKMIGQSYQNWTRYITLAKHYTDEYTKSDSPWTTLIGSLTTMHP